MTLYGGKMDKFTESATPFPRRAGNVYMLYQGVYWNENTTVATQTKKLATRVVKKLAVGVLDASRIISRG